MRAFLINLDSREDRLSSASLQLSRFNVPFTRVSAVGIEPNFETKFPYVTPHIAAIWLSHQKALVAFLETTEEYGLILEDDFVITSSKKELAEAFNLAKAGDIIQIGFLNINFFEWVNVKFRNLRDLIFKVLNFYSKSGLPAASYFGGRFLIYSQEGLPIKLVAHDFRAGAHAYLVNRAFASSVLNFNKPLLFSVDQFYISLSTMKSFKISRIRKSLVTQSSSPSSVSFRFITQKGRK